MLSSSEVKYTSKNILNFITKNKCVSEEFCSQVIGLKKEYVKQAFSLLLVDGDIKLSNGGYPKRFTPVLKTTFEEEQF